MDPALADEVARQLGILRRGTVQIISEDELARKLARSIRENRPLRVKLGVDPTANDLHLGFSLPLTKLRLFSDLGHQAVLIVGDATAMVGDPSGRNKARPQLTRADVDAYASSYLEQASLILDLDRVEIRRNSEWLLELGTFGLVQLAAKATVAQLLQRDDFSKRHAEGTPIYLHEFIYPLFQGYDSVAIESDVELGGQDQLFNLLIGRDLQLDAGQEPQVCMMGPLLVGLDGVRKMSKSFGNYVGLHEAPNDMYGKIMSLPDDVMPAYFDLATMLPVGEIEELLGGGATPIEKKDRLAREIVRRYHDTAAADEASEWFRKVIREKNVPEELPEVIVPESELEDGSMWIVKLIALVGFAPSNKEARRLVQQGGVSLDGITIVGDQDRVAIVGGEVLKVGKRKFARLVRGS